jgi:hypothetical protein
VIDNGERESIEFLPRVWGWLVVFASTGGLADYMIQVQRGLKPDRTLPQMVMAGCVHVLIAAMVGTLCALGAVAAGSDQWYELGFAAGGGGMMGARALEVVLIIIKAKGVDLGKGKR